MSSAVTALCHFAKVGRGEATGAEGQIQTHLIASCDKWRGRCVEIISTRTVGVNRRGTKTIAPQMSVFKQMRHYHHTAVLMWHRTFGLLLCTLNTMNIKRNQQIANEV